MMNCQNVKLLLSEFTDETLDAAAAWQVQTHLSGCAACAGAARDLASVKRLVQTLPAKAPSAGFDAALAERLALTRRPAAPLPLSWHARLAQFLALRLAAPARQARPALALGAVLAAGVFTVVLTERTAAPPAPAAAVRGADPAFVAACVAQHHRDAASEPLADLSAQTLAGSLDSPAPSGSASVSTDSDAGLF